MSRLLTKRSVLRVGLWALSLGLGFVLVTEAQAFHGRRRTVVVYDAGYCPPAYAGPSSFNPVGFGFGGYSYGGYPYYGYYGFLPGPYAGFSGYGPPPGPIYGPASYNAYAAAAATGLDAVGSPQCAVGLPTCEAPCGMTPHAYRRYLRRLNRAMARCGWLCAPLAAPCAYGAILGTSAILDGGDAIDARDDVLGDSIDAQLDGPAAEPVAPPIKHSPVDESPRPGLERSL